MYRLVHYLVPCGTVECNRVFREPMPRTPRPRKGRHIRDQLLQQCLAAFVRAGTLDLSLDQLAEAVRTSKRMLIHYFGSRDGLEQMAMSLLEDGLRARFRVGAFPAGTPAHAVVTALWNQVTSPQSHGVLLLTMDLTRRSWSGSESASAFFEEQQRLWSEMLSDFLPDPGAVEALLQMFQGATLVYLVTGDRERGRRALERLMRGGGLDGKAKK